jgi:hypothetical protein
VQGASVTCCCALLHHAPPPSATPSAATGHSPLTTLSPAPAPQPDSITSLGQCNNTWNSDVFGHGTAMAAIIGAVHDTQGIVGVAPLGSSMHFYNPFDPNLNGATSGTDVVFGMQVGCTLRARCSNACSLLVPISTAPC